MDRSQVPIACDERVRWLDPPEPILDACVLCGNGVGNKLFMNVMQSHAGRGRLNVARCSVCDSAWFPAIRDLGVPYPDLQLSESAGFRLFIRHYLELVSGIDWKVAIAERLPTETFTSMLEVGCNAGAFMDYARLVWNVDVVGLEPSAYGIAGSEALDLRILPSYMSDAAELQGSTFDFVCAIEVLEHVDDPQAFLIELRDFMAPGGVVMLTTPGSHCLHPDHPRGEMLAALSPGAHRFVASLSYLETMVQEAGFAWTHVEKFGMTQVAYLSDHPIDLADFNETAEVWIRRRTYFQLAVERSLGDEQQQLGDRINRYATGRATGESGDATAEREIEALLRLAFDIELTHLQPLLEHQATVELFEQFGARMPFNLPDYLFWRGQRSDVDEAQRTNLWEASALLCAYGLRTDAVNLFIYVETLKLATAALSGRLPGARRKSLRVVLDQIPEATHMSISAPSKRSTLRRHVSALKRLNRSRRYEDST